MYSDMSSWISESSSPNRNSASVLDSSVLPTPDGPAKMNEPPGPLRVLQPAPGPPDGPRERLDGHVLPDHPPVKLILHPQQPLRFLLGELEHRHARRGRQDLRDQLRGHLGDGVHAA